jgi:sugar/nucleoside kinase (ribokinase family)
LTVKQYFPSEHQYWWPKAIKAAESPMMGAIMSIVVVGSIAFDSIKTPFGERKESLGGAANYFSVAAQYFTQVHMVGIIGEDYPLTHLDYLKRRGVDTSGIEKVLGRSFHWQGEYGFDLNEAKTINTELNVFEHFKPKMLPHLCGAQTVFLANIDPELQIHVLSQMTAPKVRALDSMNFWIERRGDLLKKAISMIDILFINEAEIRALSGEHNIIKAARAASKMGARIVVIKRGEYGAIVCFDNQIAFIPAYPSEEVFDPTGAGDTFAGGFLGYLDKQDSLDMASLRQAMLVGTVMSSFVIEQFSFDRLLNLSRESIEERRKKLMSMTHARDE